MGDPTSVPFYLEPVVEGSDGEQEQDDFAAASTTNVINSSMIPIKASAKPSPPATAGGGKGGDAEKEAASQKKEKIVKVKQVPPSEQRERSRSRTGTGAEGTPGGLGGKRGSMRFSISGVYAFNTTPSHGRNKGRSQSMQDLDTMNSSTGMISPSQGRSPTRSPLANTFTHADLTSPDARQSPAAQAGNSQTSFTGGGASMTNLASSVGGGGDWIPQDPVNVQLEETELFVQQCVVGEVGSPRQRVWSRHSGSPAGVGSPQSAAADPSSPGSPGARSSTSSSSPLAGAARIVASAGPKQYGYQVLDVSQEVDRYVGGATGDDDEGECGCDYGKITRHTRGFDYSRYHAHTLYDKCVVCHRQPASFLCLHDFEGVCPSHVEAYTNRNEESKSKCTLYINIQEISTSYDRIFWCEACKRFTWKFTDEYEPLTDQIAVSKGTYLDAPVTDVWVKQYMTKINQKPEDEHKAVQDRRTRRKNSVMECMTEADGSASSTIIPAIGMPTLETPTKKEEGAAATGSDAANKDKKPLPVAPMSGNMLSVPGQDPNSRKSSGASDEFLVEKWNRKDGAATYVQSTVRAMGSSMQGWRSGQEDAEAVFTVEVKLAKADARDALDCSCSVFCVFDGHGGDAVAKIAARDIKKHLESAFFEAPPLRHGGGDEHPATANTPNPGEVFSATSDDAAVIHDHFSTIFRTAFLSLDKEIQDSEEGMRGDFNTVGATCCCVAITEDFIICANLGDSGAVLFHPADTKRRRLSMEGPAGGSQSPNMGPATNPTGPHRRRSAGVSNSPHPEGTGAALLGAGSKDSSRRASVSVGSYHQAGSTIALVPLSTAHRLSDETESSRVRAAGYTIQDDRIEGMLAVPRAFGDFDFKMCGGKSQEEQAVSCCPDVMILPKKRRGKRSELVGEVLEEKDWTIIVACDGIWDTMPKDDVCRLAHQALYQQSKLQEYSMTAAAKENNSFTSSGGGNNDSKVVVASKPGEPGSAVPPAQSLPPADLDVEMMHACNSIFDHVIAPSLNDQGLGMDNMSLLLMRPTTDELKEVQVELSKFTTEMED